MHARVSSEIVDPGRDGKPDIFGAIGRSPEDSLGNARKGAQKAFFSSHLAERNTGDIARQSLFPEAYLSNLQVMNPAAMPINIEVRSNFHAGAGCDPSVIVTAGMLMLGDAVVESAPSTPSWYA